MDNQHRQIKGYRELTPEDIALMNEAKAIGEQMGDLIKKLEAMPNAPAGPDQELTGTIDKRWLAMGKTSLQNGVMQVVRSITQPTTF